MATPSKEPTLLRWSDPRNWPQLENTQANILKGHGRKESINLFMDIADVRAFRAWLKDHLQVTHALDQLQGTTRFKRARDERGAILDGGAIGCIAFSAKGLRHLGVDDDRLPVDGAFRGGMIGAGAHLHDSAATEWDFAAPDVWLMIADDNGDRLKQAASETLQRLGGAVVVQRIEHGIAQKINGEGVEHFGYVDGRSQPLFLAEDLEAEEHLGISQWNPGAALESLLISDPLINGHELNSSYLVFRKLEQDVAGFKLREEELAGQLLMDGEDAERAGAMVVGRFEDGTPLALSTFALGVTPSNDFDYSQGAAAQCPLHAHVRKVNPRTASTHRHLMARRGITYGNRTDFKPPFPSDGVGLLFAAYMADISDQFEFTQATWANQSTDSETGNRGTGADPVIGQGIAAQQWSTGNADQKLQLKFADFVKLRGGEYFFAPSIAGIRSLALDNDTGGAKRPRRR